jgi:hypothetical protein
MTVFRHGLWLSWMISLAVAEPIEEPDVEALNGPFNAGEMKVFGTGAPPPVRTGMAVTLGGLSRKPLVRFEGDKGESVEIRGCTLSIRWNAFDRIRDMEPKFSITEGIQVFRDADGRVVQSWSDVGVQEIVRKPAGLELILWDIQDTEYGGSLPGTRKGAEGKVPNVVVTVEEISRDPDKGLLETLVVRRYRDGTGSATRHVLRHGAKRTQLVTEEYSAVEAIPENLESRENFQRIYWAEGPGVRDLYHTQEKQPDGTLDLVKDVDQTMKVDDKGVRTIVTKKDKLIDPE